MTRHVFVCIDGTHARSKTETNIWRVVQLVRGDKKNCEVLYQEGIASLSATPNLQAVLASEIYSEAYAQYKRLVDIKVTADDRLYIFGYSRGAIAARILAQMITNDVARKNVVEDADKVAIVRRNTVDFLGLFDPVRGYPSFNGKRGYDEYVYNNSSIENISEIISLDDAFPFLRPDAYLTVKQNRNKSGDIKFRLLGSRESSDEKSIANRTFNKKNFRHYCLMPGVHRDIGGQNGNLALSRFSLFQMLTDLFSAFPDVQVQFNLDTMNALRRDVETHSDILVGEGSSFFRCVLRCPRKFDSDANATVHPLVIKLNGKKNISRHVVGGRWRKYKAPKYCLEWGLYS